MSKIKVSEIFVGIQGEGVSVGVPCVFIRLAGCLLNCKYCDTKKIRDKGAEYEINELSKSITPKLKKGYHLVITGGSPLLQQARLLDFFTSFYPICAGEGYLTPTVEIENECKIPPPDPLSYYINQWNNSPKLSNSGNLKKIRYVPEAIAKAASKPNSWFKFVIEKEEDWDEIETDFLDTKLIRKNQILLMPKGRTRKQIIKNSEISIKLAIENGVRYSPREHIMLWNGKGGV